MGRAGWVLAVASIVLLQAAAPSSVAIASSPYVKAYANVVNHVEYNVNAETVQATADGGSIVLGLTQAPKGPGVSWLLKLDPIGAPQWQKEIGCFSTPPGSYADAVSLQQTADGGYVLAGGTIGCGAHTICSALSGIQCGLVERLDSRGTLVWSRVYGAGGASSGFATIRQTTDGGFIATGTATDFNQKTGALIVKLDGLGRLQWRTQLGPAGSTQALLHDVEQTADSGYVAVGEFYVPRAGAPLTSVLVVRLDPLGNLLWQQGYNTLDSKGSPSAVEQATSVVQTADGGFAVAGAWNTSFQPGQCCDGALLLKLGLDGSIQFQKAYSSGVYCFFNGFNETCTAVGGFAYSVHQVTGGGYVLAGDSNLELSDGAPIEPWLAAVDNTGNLVWQHLYYEVNKATNRPLGENFASSAVPKGGGIEAAGFTENANSTRAEILGVRTDSSGLVGSCGEVHPATPLQAIDPWLSMLPPSLSVSQPAIPITTSSSTTLPAAVAVRTDC